MASSYTNIVSHGLLGTHPVVTTFRYAQDSTTADLEIELSLEYIAKFLNQTTTVTQKAPGMWDVRLTLDGAGSTAWAYEKTSGVSAAITGTVSGVYAIPNADAALFEEGNYYQDEVTGEIIYIVSIGTAGASNTDVYMERGLFGTKGTNIGSGDTFINFGKIIVTIPKIGATDSPKIGGGFVSYVPMPMPGFGQKYFSNE